MKKLKNLILVCGVIIAITLTITQSIPADTKQFFESKSDEVAYQKDKFSPLDIASYSLELFTKNLPYLNSK